eukprot:gene3922-13996_t
MLTVAETLNIATDLRLTYPLTPHREEGYFYSMLTVAETLNIATDLRLTYPLTPHEERDVFYSMLTVAETLNIATELRLPSHLTPLERQEYTNSQVARLGLAKSLSTTVGDKKKRGLSGGEKKRLSIGCELIGSPSLIFLDEPTTGLDAFAAEKVMSTLKQLASDQGHTVVCSIHQPRTSIYSMFDDLMLMSEGELVYCGPVSEVITHFSVMGQQCPAQCNPAEFLADLISIDTSSPDLEAESRARVSQLVAAWKAKQAKSSASVVSKADQELALASDSPAPKIGWRRQIQLLAQRSWRQATRDKAANMARIMSNLSSAIIFGAIFWRIKKSQSSIQDRLGLLQVAAINTAMSSLVKTLNVFPSERVIITRERAKAGSYGTAPYLIAKLAAELPVGAIFPLIFGALVYPFTGLNPSPTRFLKFLGVITLESFTSSALGLAVGSFAPSTEAAVAIGPAVMLLFIVFGGFYVNADNVPGVLKFLPNTSLIKQGFEALVVNEFDGLEFEPNANGGGMLTGDDVLQWLSFKRKIPSCITNQARILLVYYWFTFCVLRKGAKSFLVMEKSTPSANPEWIEARSGKKVFMVIEQSTSSTSAEWIEARPTLEDASAPISVSVHDSVHFPTLTLPKLRSGKKVLMVIQPSTLSANSEWIEARHALEDASSPVSVSVHDSVPVHDSDSDLAKT